MTPTEQAARWLADVPRVYPQQSMIAGKPLTVAILEADALAAISRLFAPGDELVAQATAADLDGLLNAARKLAQYASYAEIVGGISVNRPQVREWCDAVFAAIKTMPEDEGFEPVAPNITALLARISALTATVAELQNERDKMEIGLATVLAREAKTFIRHDEKFAAAEADVSRLRDRLARMEEKLRWAHDTLWEINPSNYDHDEVCRLNDASVEVILGIAPLLGETHGKSPEWWADRAALESPDDGGKHE